MVKLIMDAAPDLLVPKSEAYLVDDPSIFRDDGQSLSLAGFKNIPDAMFYADEWKEPIVCSACRARQPLDWVEYGLCLMSLIGIVQFDTSANGYKLLEKFRAEMVRQRGSLHRNTLAIGSNKWLNFFK